MNVSMASNMGSSLFLPPTTERGRSSSQLFVAPQEDPPIPLPQRLNDLHAFLEREMTSLRRLAQEREDAFITNPQFNDDEWSVAVREVYRVDGCEPPARPSLNEVVRRIQKFGEEIKAAREKQQIAEKKYQRMATKYQCAANDFNNAKQEIERLEEKYDADIDILEKKRKEEITEKNRHIKQLERNWKNVVAYANNVPGHPEAPEEGDLLEKPIFINQEIFEKWRDRTRMDLAEILGSILTDM